MRTLLFAAIVSTVVTATPAQDQKYPIHFSTPDKVGHKYTISASGSRLVRSVLTQGGRVTKTVSADYRVAFQGHAEILAVDGKGTGYKIAYTTDRFTKTEDGRTTTVLGPGSVIVSDGSQAEGGQILLKDAVMSAAAREAFSMVLPPHQPDSESDEDIISTKEPRGVGDSWPINKQAASKNLKESMIIPVDRLNGTVVIVSKGTLDGHECLNFVADMKGDGIVLTKAPAGFSSNGGTLQSTLRGCLPISPSVLSSRENMELSTQVRMTGNAGTPNDGLTMEVNLTQKNDVLVRPDSGTLGSLR